MDEVRQTLLAAGWKCDAKTGDSREWWWPPGSYAGYAFTLREAIKEHKKAERKQ